MPGRTPEQDGVAGATASVDTAAERPGPLPLRAGSSGDAVRDLQHRLHALGYAVPSAELGSFGPRTEEALRAFQAGRGLLPSGCCDEHSWSALVEAGFRLGDRLLYLRRPMLRGDDVAELQRQLGGLGFDAGRVDGIFGPDTEAALKDFQRNVALPTDAVCGPDVLAAIERLGSHRNADSAVAPVRERERLRTAPADLHGRRVVIGHSGDLDALATAVERQLHDAGAQVVRLQHPDLAAQAEHANEFAAEAYVGLTGGEPPCWVAFYATDGYESPGGHHLATLVSRELTSVASSVEQPRGMRLPILRETRMPAVVVHLGPPSEVVQEGAEVAAAVAQGVRQWAETPTEL